MEDSTLPGNAAWDPMRTYRAQESQSPEMEKRRHVTRVPDPPLKVPSPREPPEPQKRPPAPPPPKNVALDGIAKLDVIRPEVAPANRSTPTAAAATSTARRTADLQR